METYTLLYEWTAKIGLNSDERIILAIIQHFTTHGRGFFAGYKGMEDRTGIRKSKCKKAVNKLIEMQLVSEARETLFRQTRIVWKALPKNQ